MYFLMLKVLKPGLVETRQEMCKPCQITVQCKTTQKAEIMSNKDVKMEREKSFQRKSGLRIEYCYEVSAQWS